MLIQLGHSPDPDDAFMFYALTKDAIPTEGFSFKHILKDIQTLNEWAEEGKLEVTAISVHTYPYVSDKYALLSHGASIGDGYGPMIVAKEGFPLSELSDKRIAIPGERTTAFLTLRLIQPELNYIVLPFDEIINAVKKDRVDAGLIIHEGQLTYKNNGLVCVLDLGAWWKDKTNLPLPLGCNVVRRDLGEDTIRTLSKVLHNSIKYSLDHRDEALDYALKYGRGLKKDTADQFVGMYVNDYTLDYGDQGRKAVETLLTEASSKGLVPNTYDLSFY